MFNTCLAMSVNIIIGHEITYLMKQVATEA